MTDIFGALCYGATLVPLETDADRLTPARFIARNGISVWNSTPSAISLMMRARQVTAENLESVRLFNFCGEPLLKEHLKAIFKARPDVLVQNTYGPTEATISMTALELRAQDYESACELSVAIGDAVPGMAYHLVGGSSPDEGEIVITGPQLADGYWRDEAKTRETFRSLDVGGAEHRGYFTGDWAERRAGNVYFKERIDFQVKVRGHRVELDEVAFAIRGCGWPVVCVFKRGEALAAVVEAVEGSSFDEAALRSDLKEQLDAHAIPERIRLIDHMPRSENDKIDRKAAAEWLEAGS
jgi:D-alanine--poly(phosphoribitol) ligase subunit 1